MNRRAVADDGTVIGWQDTGEGAPLLMLDNALTLPPELRAGMPYRFAPADVADTTVPTLLILGEHSVPELGTTVQHITDALAMSSVVTLPGQGHGAMFTAPELLSSEIRRFVAELDGFRLPPDG